MNMRVVLVDDHQLVRAGLKKLLETIPEIVVVGEASDGLSALTLIAELLPDLVFMDIVMPKLNGLDAARQLLVKFPETRVIMVSMYHNEDSVRQALRIGAAGFLLKDAAPSELIAAIAAIRRGDTYLSLGVTKGVLSDYIKRLQTETPIEEQLTPRQRQVLQLIAEGSSTKDIARLLDISIKTVETHRSLLMKQLDIHQVAGLVRYAIKNGLVSLDE